MEISKENISALNSLLHIQISPSDYTEKVEKVIREHQRKANVPGFRPGKVPVGHIKKLYGKSILADEMDKLLSKSLNDYLTENHIEILGNPLPRNEFQDNNNWDNPENFEFQYEIGLAPAINCALDASHSFEYFEILVDDYLMNKYVDDIRRRQGNYTKPDFYSQGCVLYGEFNQLDEDHQLVEDGIKTTTTFVPDTLNNEIVKARFEGLKTDDYVDFNPFADIGNQTEVSAMLKVSKEDELKLKSDYRFIIKSISRIELAELNQELFDKVYGPDSVGSEEEFKSRVTEEISKIFSVDADRKLKADIEDYLMNKINPELPDEFLKKWMMTASEKPLEPEQIDREYGKYAAEIKWRLIENQIIKDNNISIEESEIIEFSRQLVRNQFARYGQYDLDEAQVDDLAKRYLQTRERIQEVHESIAGRKVFEYLKSFYTLERTSLPYDDFIKEVSKA